MPQIQNQDPRAEAALYWSAISLIVCEGLPMEKAASELGMARNELREILKRRSASAASQARLVSDSASFQSAEAVLPQ